MRFSCGHEISDSEVLRAAGVIRARMRRSHRGGRPPKQHSCRWCPTKCLGKLALELHERECSERPTGLVPITADELIAWSSPG
jgi:hypothetical protein